jgi:restriction system protein
LHITEAGRQVLARQPQSIGVADLEQFPEYVAFRSLRHATASGATEVTVNGPKTPEEILGIAQQKIREDLAMELLANIKQCSPAFFERLVVDVLVSMGYGGSRQDAGNAVGKSGDGGIDGIIKEDRLGLDVIYLQAKRWEGVVGRPEVQKFAGALQGHRARKGVFITTSSFTQEAMDYVARIDSKIVLLDGEHLTQLMIDHNVGVAPLHTYEIKKIDLDYFIET